MRYVADVGQQCLFDKAAGVLGDQLGVAFGAEFVGVAMDCCR